ncbi:MAG TPA: hypothetical protein VJX67_20215, partial [Blastocatellia bacterium]|nr:hypothetical protein [Blastocatellia bacterium]
SWDFFGQISTPPGLEKSVDKGPIEMRRDLPFDQFMTNLCARGLQEEIRGNTFDPDRFGLYYRAVGCGMTDAEEFRDWLVGGLQRLPAEKWRDEIVSEGKLLWVILKLASQEVPVDLPPLVYALAEYARELAAGAPIPLCDVMEAGEHRSLLFKSLGEAGGQGLRDSIYETAKAANGEIDGRFFRIFGEQFGSAPGRSRC